MLDAPWRRIGQAFHITGGGAGSEDPVVTDLEVAAREPGLYSILQRDRAGSGRHQPIVVNVPRLIPTPYPGVSGDAVNAGWDVAVEGEEAILLIDGSDDLSHRPSNLALLGVVLPVLDVVIEYLHPIVRAQSQYLVPTYVPDLHLTVRYKRLDGEDHRTIVPRPFKCSFAQFASMVDLDPVEAVFQAPITTAGSQEARIFGGGCGNYFGTKTTTASRGRPTSDLILTVHLDVDGVSPPQAVVPGCGEELVVDRGHCYYVVCMADLLPDHVLEADGVSPP